MLKLLVIGNLGKDCTTNTVNGKQVINFSVAHTESWKDKNGERQEKTTWVDCAYWTESESMPKYLVKGKMVFVEGTPEVRSFTRADGTTGTSQGLRVTHLQLLGGGQNAANNGAAGGTNTQAGANGGNGGHRMGAGGQYGQPVGAGAGAAGDVNEDLPF